jgi:hypothetical protein
MTVKNNKIDDWYGVALCVVFVNIICINVMWLSSQIESLSTEKSVMVCFASLLLSFTVLLPFKKEAYEYISYFGMFELFMYWLIFVPTEYKLQF